MDSGTPTTPPRQEYNLVDEYRSVRNSALKNFLYPTASFFGEELMVITGAVEDIHFLALSYYYQKQYARALCLLLKEKRTLDTSIHCRYLAGRCSIKMGNGNQALEYLGYQNSFSGEDLMQFEIMNNGVKLKSLMCSARGKAYLLINEIDDARDCFKEALTIDSKCYDAFECLVEFNMMEEQEELLGREFITNLPYEEHCGVRADFFRGFYSLDI